MLRDGKGFPNLQRIGFMYLGGRLMEQIGAGPGSGRIMGVYGNLDQPPSAQPQRGAVFSWSFLLNICDIGATK
jgi:hypothetical protein